MANYPYELAQDAAYQSHTSRLTELWSLPRPAQGLNTNNNNMFLYSFVDVQWLPEDDQDKLKHVRVMTNFTY